MTDEDFHDGDTTSLQQTGFAWRNSPVILQRRWVQLPRDWKAVICGLVVVGLVLGGVTIPW